MDTDVSLDGPAGVTALRVLAQQVDKMDKRLERVEDMRLPELLSGIHKIELHLAEGFVTTDDCKTCRDIQDKRAKNRTELWLGVIPIVISIVAVGVAVYLKT